MAGEALPQAVQELIRELRAEADDDQGQEPWPRVLLNRAADALEGRAQAPAPLRPHLHTEACYAVTDESDLIRCADAHHDVPPAPPSTGADTPQDTKC